MHNKNGKTTIKAIIPSNKIPKTKQNQMSLPMSKITDKTKIFKMKRVGNSKNMSSIDYYTDISIQKYEPSSNRSNKENPIIQNLKKKNEKIDDDPITPVEAIYNNNMMDIKRCHSLKKQLNKTNPQTKEKYTRPSSMVSHQESSMCLMQGNYSYATEKISTLKEKEKANAKETKLQSDIEIENKQLKHSMNILVNYIAILNKKIDDIMNKTVKQKNEEINQLKVYDTYLYIILEF